MKHMILVLGIEKGIISGSWQRERPPRVTEGGDACENANSNDRVCSDDRLH